ncbi:MAG: glycine--tRNA ligase subunit beta [Betaproteobacteria bacterium]|nr:glycine--tRNA ligase subunit beta [Betaproteobacteria bacterium]
MRNTLLIELLTEELPPKRLKQLSESFSRAILKGLNESQLIEENSDHTAYATPRRLAIAIKGVLDQQPTQRIEKKGPAVKQALLADGNPSPALLGFMRSSSISLDQLVIIKDNKGQEVYGFSFEEAGKNLEDLLPDILQKTFSQLPVAKIMRWGDSNFSFVRPVHGLMVLHGETTIPITILGLKATNQTRGHRFLGSQAVTVTHADQYEQQLRDEGHVIAQFETRKQMIQAGLTQQAQGLNIVGDDSLLNEVTSLVEWPEVFSGVFDEQFLTVPSECLVLSMQQHQKYFPLKNNHNQLQAKFLLVSNLQPADPNFIVNGNERVLRARLSDAQFFYQTDLKTPLINRLGGLKQVVYIKSLGSMFDRVHRIKTLVSLIAKHVPIDEQACIQAAELCKADLTSDMVGEFPELQGIMGKYYALNDGYSSLVAEAVEDHYHPRFANDTLPRSTEGLTLALAEKIESLVGLFACGQIPTGDKDPYGLRRASLGIIRIVIEGHLNINLEELINQTATVFTQVSINEEVKEKIIQFIIERLKGYLKEQGYRFDEIESILPFARERLDLLPKRLSAVKAFKQLADSQVLSAANKRITNILKKNNDVLTSLQFDRLTDETELTLIRCLTEVSEQVNLAMQEDNFHGALKALIPLVEPINHFFDHVMIMSEDQAVRVQRLTLLKHIHQLMQKVADIGLLDA